MYRYSKECVQLRMAHNFQNNKTNTIMSVEDNTQSDNDDSNVERFSQQRKESATHVEEQADALLCEYFGASKDSIQSVERSIDTEYSNVDDGALVEMLDFHCIDKFVDAPECIYPIAQRLRPENEQWDVDFSLRWDNGTPYRAEYELFRDAWENDGLLPTHYAFGVHDVERLTEFHLINVEWLCNQLYNMVTIEYQGPYPTDEHNVHAIYIPINELKSCGCIEYTFSEEQLSEVVEWDEI